MSSPELIFRGRYRVIYAVDERPGSRTYRCRDDQSGRLVLVAEIPTDGASTQEDLELLAKQIATVKVDGLLPLADHFAEGAAYYLVCDDPGGQDLDRALRTRGGPLPESEALAQGQRLLALTEHLHSQKPQLFLGDPTPTDLCVSDSGEWLLTPFTLARPIGQSPSPYRAPELAQADAEPNTVSDIYAVGALLYQVATGWAPPTSEQQAAGMPLNGPRVLNPQISQLAEQALLRSLQLKFLNRYQTAREMRIALETVQMLRGRSLGLGADVLSGMEMLPANTGQQAEPAGQQPLRMPPAPQAPQPVPQAPQPAPQAPQGQQQYPPPGYPPPGYAPAGYPPPGYAPQQKRGISTGCLIGIAVALALVALAICGALGLFIISSQSRGSLQFPGIGAAATAVPTAAPTAAAEGQPTAAPTDAADSPTAAPAAGAELGPSAIAVSNVDAITQTATITSSVFGPTAYSPDGGSLAVGVGSVVSVVNAETLESRAQLAGHAGRVTSLAWSDDGALLASGASDDNNVLVWDGRSDTLRQTLSGHTGWIRSLAFSPTGTTLASGSTDQTIKLWDAQSGTLLRTLTGHTGMLGGLAFSPDGSRLVSGSRDGSVRLWDVASGAEVSGFSFQAPIDPDTTGRYWTTGVAVSPDGSEIAVGATDGMVYLLDAATGEQRRQLQGHTNWIVIRGLAYAPDGAALYSASLDGTVRRWDTATGRETAQLAGHSLDVFSISLSADGTQLVSASDQEGRLLVWDLTTERAANSLRVGQGIVTSIAFSPDSAVLGSVGYNGVLNLQLVADGRSRSLAGSTSATQALAFLDGGRLATITDQGTVALLDITAENSAELEGLSGAPLSVAASANGSLLAGGTISGTVTLWEGGTGAVQGELRGSLPATTLLAISDDGALLAAAGPPSDPRIEIWDVARKAVLHTFTASQQPLVALAFQPGGTLVAAASLDGAMRLYDARDGLELRTIRAAPENGWFASLAFSPDGSMVATGTPTGLIQFWNPQSGAELASVRQDYGAVALAFSPDAQILAVSARDATMRIYRIP